jgi:hypothetical protein
MTTLSVHGHPAFAVSHPRTSWVAAIVAVALVIAAGGYGATTTFGPDAQPAAATSQSVVSREQALRELDQSLAGQYGSAQSQSAPAVTQPSGPGAANVAPSKRAMKDLGTSVAGQYGSGR